MKAGLLALFVAMLMVGCPGPDKGEKINVMNEDGHTWQIGVKEGEWFMDKSGRYQCAVNLCTPADASAIAALEEYLGPRQVEQMKKYKDY